jgi:hypothetical protein
VHVVLVAVVDTHLVGDAVPVAANEMDTAVQVKIAENLR